MSGVRHPWTLGDVLMRRPRPLYDFIYRRGAPWEGGPRRELVELVDSGDVTPELPGPRAIDLGCGTGSSVTFLAERGFDAVGVDISPVAISKARMAAEAAGVAPRLVVADLMDPTTTLGAPFDLLLDGGMIDDFPRALRPAAVARVAELARPGSVFVTWCFYAHDRDLPTMSFSGPSRRVAPGIEPEEFHELYATEWDIDLLRGGVDEGFACFRLTRIPNEEGGIR